MKVLVMGSGGREHALVWSLSRTATSRLDLFCAPGNAGIAELAQCVRIPVDDHDALVDEHPSGLESDAGVRCPFAQFVEALIGVVVVGGKDDVVARQLEERVDVVLTAIVDNEIEAGPGQISRHGLAHDPKSDEPDWLVFEMCHACSPLRCRYRPISQVFQPIQ